MKWCLLLMLVLPASILEGKDDFNFYKRHYPKLTRNIYNNVLLAVNKYGIHRSLILAIIDAESQFYPFAFSKAKARGLMQVMPFHHKGDAQDLYDVRFNIMTGTRVFREYLNLAKNDVALALNFYNCGPNSRYISKAYIFKILSNVKKTDPVFTVFEMESSISYLKF